MGVEASGSHCFTQSVVKKDREGPAKASRRSRDQKKKRKKKQPIRRKDKEIKTQARKARDNMGGGQTIRRAQVDEKKHAPPRDKELKKEGKLEYQPGMRRKNPRRYGPWGKGFRKTRVKEFKYARKGGKLKGTKKKKKKKSRALSRMVRSLSSSAKRKGGQSVRRVWGKSGLSDCAEKKKKLQHGRARGGLVEHKN